MTDLAVETLLALAPKAELHLHLVGSASLDTVASLIERHGRADLPQDHDALAAFFEFRDFAHFIEVYAAVNDLVRDQHDVVSLLVGAAEELRSRGVRYAEITVTPFMHEIRDLRPGALFESLDEGRRRARSAGVELAWIFDIPGELGDVAARRTTELAVSSTVDGLVGFGLAGAEAGVDRGAYGWAFEAARASGLRSVPHAGEGDGPASVRAAIEILRADRIGHGVRAVEDPELVEALADRGVPLEVCPSSNVCTRVVRSLEDHPIVDLWRRGVVVTINTDDPHMFGTNLTEEYRRVAKAFSLGADDVAELICNAIRASFMPDSLRTAMLEGVADALAVANDPAGRASDRDSS